MVDVPDPDEGREQIGVRYHLDLDTGDIWEASDDRVWTLRGQVPGSNAGDGADPSKVTGLTLSVINTEQPDGTTVPGILATWDAVPETDIIGYEAQFDPYDGTFTSVATRQTGGTATALEAAIGGVEYSVRVRAFDKEGRYGPWSDTETITTTDDGEAPSVPSGLTVLPGYRLLGATWSANSEMDFDHYEVQWAPDLTGAPDTANANVLQTASSNIVISGLNVLATYWIRVRAVDRSGMTQTSDVDPTPVNAGADPEAGWSDWESGTTTAVGSEDLAVHALAAEFVTTGVLNADRIVAGALTIGAPGMAEGISVYDEFGRFIGSWDQDGMLMVNPNATNEAMWLHAGALRFTAEYAGTISGTTWTTGVDARGINAEAITFGDFAAGSNMVPNAGAEMQAFSTSADSSKQWTLTTDWDDATGAINLNVSTGDLKMTTL